MVMAHLEKKKDVRIVGEKMSNSQIRVIFILLVRYMLLILILKIVNILGKLIQASKHIGALSFT